MSGRNIFMLAYLPTPGELSDQPALSCAQFLSLLAEDVKMARPRELSQAILLSDDLLQRDAHLAGEIDLNNENDPKISDPIILTTLQLCDEEPLPDYLVLPEDTQHLRIAADVVWEAYFRYVMAAGQKWHSKFLTAWVGYEVALRNGLAEERAKTLELEATDYFVAEDLADTAVDLSGVLNEFATAANPLAAQLALDSARWQWLKDNDAYFSFGDDELIAYAAKIMLQKRWSRLTELQEAKK